MNLGVKSWLVIGLLMLIAMVFTLESVLKKSILPTPFSENIEEKNTKAKKYGRDIEHDLSQVASLILKTDCGKQPLIVPVELACDSVPYHNVCLSEEVKNFRPPKACAWLTGKLTKNAKHSLLDLYDVYGNGNTLGLIAQAKRDIR